MKKKMVRFGVLVLIVSLPLVGFPAQAALIQGTDPRFGPNSLTIDTSTELGWLNLTESAGLSYNQVLSDTAPGGIFSGYRFATVDEVLGLYSSAGIPGPGYYSLGNPSIQSLISLVGPTGTAQGWPQVLGITGSSVLPTQNSSQYTAGIYASGLNGALDYLVTAPGTAEFGRDYGTPDTGSWLVMQVPEPGVSLILAAGLIGFAVVKRKKWSRQATVPDKAG